MASEYLRWKYRDVKPDEPYVMTKAEKRRNWWHYHKWYVVLAAAFVAIALDILLHALGVGQVAPDIQIAYSGSTALSDETVCAIEQALEAQCGDYNGDGEVLVKLVQYLSFDTGDSDALYFAQAAQVQLVADISEGTSCFFLLEDPETFQRSTQALCNADGQLPPDGELSAAGRYYLWGDCPCLALTAVGEQADFVAGLAFARRGYLPDKTPENASELDALWQLLTEGAVAADLIL